MDTGIEMLGYRPELASYFTDLNLAWVEKYFEVEPVDREILENPSSSVIDKGGFIFFAKVGDDIAGTFALMRKEDGVFELSKMAVSERFQGKKIGNFLLEFCLAKARELGAKKIVLFSNTILGPAIHLYRKYGFIEVPLENSEYKRSNIKMEIDIK